MEVTFPAQAAPLQESTTVQTAKSATAASVQSVATRTEPPAQYFNPKISVDSKSGMVLLQYRSQTGDMKMQIPAENVVDHYNTHGYRRFDPPGTVVVSEPDSSSTAPPPAPVAPAASPSSAAPSAPAASSAAPSADTGSVA